MRFANQASLRILRPYSRKCWVVIIFQTRFADQIGWRWCLRVEHLPVRVARGRVAVQPAAGEQRLEVGVVRVRRVTRLVQRDPS